MLPYWYANDPMMSAQAMSVCIVTPDASPCDT